MRGEALTAAQDDMRERHMRSSTSIGSVCKWPPNHAKLLAIVRKLNRQQSMGKTIEQPEPKSTDSHNSDLAAQEALYQSMTSQTAQRPDCAAGVTCGA